MQDHAHMMSIPSTSATTDPIIAGWRGASAVTGLATATLKRAARAGRFPAPLELGANRVGWRQSEIDHWLASRPRRQYRPAVA
jgi:prophage regulatory protein